MVELEEPRNQKRQAILVFRYGVENHDAVDVHLLSPSHGDGLCTRCANVQGAREYLEAKQPWSLSLFINSWTPLWITTAYESAIIRWRPGR